MSDLRERVPQALARRPLLALAGLAAAAEAVALARTVGRYDRPPMALDAGFFQHAGWYVTNGAAPYADVWDPKPPLAHETSAALALLAPDPYGQHLLNVAVMAAVAVGIVVLVGAHARRITGDPAAAVVAGAAVLLLPGFFFRPALGFKPKYLLVLAGLLGVLLHYRGYPALAGAAAAAAVGYRQLAVVYPLVVLGLALQRGDRRDVARTVAGMAAAAVAVLLPVVAWGATTPMLVQVGVVPILTGQAPALPTRLLYGVVRFKLGSPLVLLGGYGLWRLARSDRLAAEWWVLVGAAWYGVVALVVDFEYASYTDLIPGLPFVAIGLGVLYADLDAGRRPLAAAVAAVVLVNVVAMGSLGLVFTPVATPEPVDLDGPTPTVYDERPPEAGPAPETLVDPRYRYWRRVEPPTCHYRYSIRELAWLRMRGRFPSCGTDLGAALELLASRGVEWRDVG